MEIPDIHARCWIGFEATWSIVRQVVGRARHTSRCAGDKFRAIDLCGLGPIEAALPELDTPAHITFCAFVNRRYPPILVQNRKGSLRIT
jgi:hypothetical protein